jgi:hypothetical protein
MAHTLRAPIVRNDVNAVSYALPLANMIALAFGITAGFKNSFIRALR